MTVTGLALTMSSLWVAAPLYLVSTFAVADLADNPYVTLGIAGAMLVVVIAPSVRWHQRQQERHLAVHEKNAEYTGALLGALNKTIERHTAHLDQEAAARAKVIETMGGLQLSVDRLADRIGKQ